MTWIIIGILGALCLFLLIRLLAVRRQLRQIITELRKNRELSYNKLLSVDLFDRSVNDLSAEINQTLDYQKYLKRETQRAENNLKQSVSDIAHDLRTPMTVINGNLQLLSQEPLSQQGREFLDICREKTDTLRQMADAFFEMSVLESSNTPANMQRVNLTKILMQFLADSEAVIRLHHLEPEIIFPEKDVFLSADEQLLLRMLGNLLNNIIKYADGSFTLTLEQDAAHCRIIFANPVRAGQMPDTERMFERCYRADTARSGGSAGLGLYIVRLLAEKQNANVSASAENGFLTLTVIF